MSRNIRRFGLLALVVLLLGLSGADPREPATQGLGGGVTPRFTSVDVFVDPRGQSLAAYQLEFVADPARVTLVGIEGGEHPAFSRPPYYDPKALASNRVILAALNTGADLPHDRTRVATLHLRVTSDDDPTYSAKMEVAGDPQGNSIPADLTLGQGAR